MDRAVGPRTGGITPSTKVFFSFSKTQIPQVPSTGGGHVCIPRKPSASKLCFQVSSLAGHGGRCPKVPVGQHKRLLRQPTLESHSQMAPPIKGTPPSQMYDDNPLLGFKYLVAPTNETARQGDPSFSNQTVPRDVQKLLGRINASATMAPSLRDTIPEGLQARQINPEASRPF